MEGDLKASRFFVATTLMYIITLDSLYAVLVVLYMRIDITFF